MRTDTTEWFAIFPAEADAHDDENRLSDWNNNTARVMSWYRLYVAEGRNVKVVAKVQKDNPNFTVVVRSGE